MQANPYERQRIDLTWDATLLAPLAELNLEIIAAVAASGALVLYRSARRERLERTSTIRDRALENRKAAQQQCS